MQPIEEVIAALNAAELSHPEPEGVTNEEIEQEAIANADTDDEYRAFKRGAFFVQEHISRPTIKPEVPPMPVPVAEQPEPEVAGLSDDAIEADFRSWYNERYHHHYFGAIPLVECIEWTRYALTRYATPQPAPVPVTERFEFSVFNSEYEEQAGGTAPTYAQALSEGQHYLSQYSQDGPHSLEIRRVEVLPHNALSVPWHGMS
jgi:hypothetical protein